MPQLAQDPIPQKESQIKIDVKRQIIRKPIGESQQWQLDENRVRAGERILTLHPVCKSGEEKISGPKEIEDRSIQCGGHLGEIIARTMMENQKIIPKSWRKSMIIFSGTKWKDSEGNIRIPIMVFCEKKWHLMYAPLSGTFFQTAKFLKLVK